MPLTDPVLTGPGAGRNSKKDAFVLCDPASGQRLYDAASVERMIVRVLRRAHGDAEPDDARAILDVAHSFADEIAAADPQFDRLPFIEAAVETGPRLVP
jgi:hypothetical protein